MLALSLDKELRFFQGIEDFSIQQLVAQSSIEAFDVAVLPGRSAFDESRAGAPAASIQSRPRRATNSGPLSERMKSGAPRASIGIVRGNRLERPTSRQ